MPKKEPERKEPSKTAGGSDVKWKSDESQILVVKEAIEKLDKKEKK